MFAVSIAGSLFFATAGRPSGAAEGPEFEYAAGACRGAWTFSAVAGTGCQVPVDWCYRGSRSRFQGKARLEQFVRRGGEEVVARTIAEAGPATARMPMPGSFSFAGTSRFDLEPGDVYGFRLTSVRTDALDADVPPAGRSPWRV